MKKKKKISVEPFMQIKGGPLVALKKHVLFVWPENPQLANDYTGRVYEKVGKSWVYRPK